MAVDNVVVILAEPDDIHAIAVAAEVGAVFNGHAIILDTADYPNGWCLTLAVDTDSEPRWVIRTKDRNISSEQVVGIWLRRPRAHQIACELKDEKVRGFCQDEARASFQGWIHGLGNRVINPLSAELAANQKPLQLIKAKEVGLKIPDTVITNDPEEARRFLDGQNGSTIFKVLTGTSWQFTETRRFKDEYSKYLENLRYAPAIFQELIEAQLDIRATVVDDTVFGASIRPDHPGAALDWRMDLASEIKPHDLPEEIDRALVDLLRALGLRFGAIDLRLTPQGEYVFLEINPGGQFLFCEIHAGHPISRTLAANLLQGPKTE